MLGHFCNCLIKLICRGKAKGKECSTSFKISSKLINCRDKLTTEIQICGEKALQVHNGLCEYYNGLSMFFRLSSTLFRNFGVDFSSVVNFNFASIIIFVPSSVLFNY